MDKNVNYNINWKQPMEIWIPMQILFPEICPEPQEPEITDFTEAQSLIAGIMVASRGQK